MPYKDKEQKKEYMKEYNQRLGVKLKHKESNKKYSHSPKGKLKRKKYKKEYKKLYPKKIKAHRLADYYLKDLRSPGTERHHPDYNQPLNVEILTIVEHKALHARQNQLNQMRAAVLAV